MNPDPAERNANGERPAPERGDGIELWGRRIGRALGWAFAAFLLFQLVRTWAP